jgi:hypothetical protein
MPWQVGTDEFDSMLQRSWGWNLGISLIPDARPVPVSEIGGFAPADLDAIARADAILQNVDRTARNPNLLESRGRLWAIDYDACLYLARALGPPRTPVRTLPAGHLMAGRGDEVIPPEIDADALAAAAPAAWVESAGTSRSELADALARYFAA